MNTKSFTLQVSSDIGSVSAEAIVPENPYCIITLAHGAGAGMNHAFMVSLANLLAAKGVVTVRLNFPSTETKQGSPEVPAVAQTTIAAAIKSSRELFPSLPLFASGKSFGGRMSSQYLSAHPDAGVKGIIFFGFPLHPPKKPSTERAEHLKDVHLPMLFLQGTRDELATWDLIAAVCAALPQSTLVKIEKANHMFKAGKQDTVSILADATDEWLTNQITPPVS